MGTTTANLMDDPRSAAPVSTRVSRSGDILLHLRRTGPSTVSGLADAMGMARSTIVDRLDRLGEGGLVRVVEARASGRGRPAATYEFDPGGGIVLSAHVGMTGARLGVSDLGAVLHGHTFLDIDIAEGPERVVAAIGDGLESLRLELGVDPARTFGIGVGLPGAIELAAIHSAGAQWSTHPVAQDLAARFGVPAFADQDVNLLALGEHAQGWPDAQSLLCVKVGSVIACGVVAGGRIIGGADGLAGDIGHTRIAGRDEPCVCGNVGCLNAVAGGAALVKQLAAAGVGVGHVRDVVRLAQQGSVPARAAIRQAGRDLGTVLAGAVNLLNPRVIAFWGYLVGDEESLLAGVRETLYQGAAPSATHNLMLISSELGDTTGLNGSALMVAEEVLAPRAVDRRLDRTASSVSNG